MSDKVMIDLETTVSSGLRRGPNFKNTDIRDIVWREKNNYTVILEWLSHEWRVRLGYVDDNQPVSHFACPTHGTLGPGAT